MLKASTHGGGPERLPKGAAAHRHSQIVGHVCSPHMTCFTRRMKTLGAFGLSAAVVLGVAQLGSYLVETRLPLHDTYVVNDVLHLTHIRNSGGVFGLFPGNSLAFAAVGTLIIVSLSVYVARNRMPLYQYICFGSIVGAAAANICDRLVYGAVIDFIDIQGIPGWHYIFNIADTAIHLGVWPLVIGALVRSDRQPAP
jgi:signal peptidase II